MYIQERHFTRIPRHIGVIPDGNRRWALSKQLEKHGGYAHGVQPGVRLYELMVEAGVEEASFYAFTRDNTSRPAAQTQAYVKASVDAVLALAERDANILVVGNTDSSVFPEELLPYTKGRVRCGKGLINVNFLVNYDWNWDLCHAFRGGQQPKEILPLLASRDISRMDMVIRWGGHTRLSGFLPVQSVYSDFYVVREYWPDFVDEHFLDALTWYQTCDVTLGG